MTDLNVVEEEHNGFVFDSSHQQALLHVLSPLVHAVSLGNLDLVDLITRDERREAGQRLATTATNAQQQRVA